jgi:hypothetical protein
MARFNETCGVWDDNSLRRCDLSGEEKEEPFCSFSVEDAAEVVEDNIATMDYSCNRCGRLADEAGQVCQPIPVGEPL